MKMFKKILLAVVVVLIIVAAAGLIFLGNIKKAAIPSYSGNLVLKGLSEQVRVYRDGRGMPHVYAMNEKDLYVAVGYLMAQDRLWQMDLIRRATTGTLSEIFGSDYVQTDLFLRSLEMTAKSKTVLGNADQAIIECMQAYADGVNAYIQDAGKKLPPEFRILSYKPDPWKLEDMANIIGYMGWDLASDNLSSEVFYHRLVGKLGPEKAAKLIPDFKATGSVVFPGFELSGDLLREAESLISSIDKLEALGLTAFSGSNNWAVSGSRTETGKPVLSNDMHLSFGSPGIWYQMHQVVPGKLNVTGVIVPGQPFVVAGHNEKIAWGMTNLMVDDIDLFAETLNPADPDQYMLNGEWRKMNVKQELIKVKGEEPETLSVRFTHRGPVISGFRKVEDVTLTMRWSGYDQSDELRAVYLLNRAGNWDDFRTAISSFRSISQNFVYADTEGNIGLNTGGGIAVRKGNGLLIRKGETDEFDWKGYVPFDQLPTSYNPSNGYVSSANNKTVPDSYPYYISAGFAMPYRINRIRQMLDEKEVFTIDDFKRMITDQHSDYAALLTPFIIKLNQNMQALSGAEQKALSYFGNWDYGMDADLIAPSVFEYFRLSFSRNLLGDELAELYDQLYSVTRDYYIYRILSGSPDEFVDNITTAEVETLDDVILKSFKDCIAELTAQHGEDQSAWAWGNIHKIRIDHPLGSVNLLDRLFNFNSDVYAVGGSNHTVSPYSYGPGFVIDHGASERHIFNTADWDESLTVIPTGASGIPASEFYLSQTETYVNKGFYKDAFTEAAVKAAAKYELTINPE